jgi:hypothetical protein
VAKRKHGGRRQQLRHPSRPIPSGVLVVECTDPACGMHPGEVRIHHLGLFAEEPATEREEAGASHAGPFTDPSDYHSEAGSGGQGTTAC